MQLIIDISETLGKQILSLTNPDEFIRETLREAVGTHQQKQREELLQDLINFQPLKVQRNTTEVIREEREKLDARDLRRVKHKVGSIVLLSDLDLS